MNLKLELYQEIHDLKVRLKDIELRTSLEHKAHFADTVKVNFKNSRPVSRDDNFDFIKPKVTNIVKSNVYPGEDAESLGSGAKLFLQESDLSSKIITMSGINFKKTLGIAENDANVVSINLDKKEKALKKPKMGKKEKI